MFSYRRSGVQEVFDAKYSFSLQKEEISQLPSVHWNIFIRPLSRELNICFRLVLNIRKLNKQFKWQALSCSLQLECDSPPRWSKFYEFSIITVDDKSKSHSMCLCFPKLVDTPSPRNLRWLLINSSSPKL